MKNQNNKDLNSGIDSTTFNRNENAYKNQKEASLAGKYKQVVRDEIGSKVLSDLSGIDQSIVKKALHKSENKSFLEGGTNLFRGGAKNPGNRFNPLNKDKVNEEENIEEPNNTRKASLLSSLTNGINDSEAKVKTEKIKKAIKVIKFLAPFIPYVLIIFGVILFMGVLLVLPNQALDKVVDGGESVFNFLTLNGYRTNTERIKATIDKASGECSSCILPGAINDYKGLDKELLYATVNNQVIISPEVYENDTVINNGGNLDLINNPFVDIYNVRTFYDMKLDMLGSTTDPGTMIYSLIGTTINKECTNEDSTGENILAVTHYIATSLLRLGAVVVDDAIDVSKMATPGINMSTLTEIVKSIFSYSAQNSSKLSEFIAEKKFAGKTLLSRDIGVIVDLIQYNDCEDNEYVKLVESKVNDYNLYYNYIASVYVPTIYNSVWNTLDDTKKTKIIHETWADIVNVRNASYQSKGINNYLYYDFSFDGEIMTNVSTSGVYNGSYVSDIPVGTKGTSWKQFQGSWSSMKLGVGLRKNGKTRTMASQGCYITSIAILMANSGTYITGSTFDPGVLAQTLIDNGGVAIDGDGSVTSHSWGTLAPNFAYVKGDWNLQRVSKAQISSTISSYLNQGYHVMVQVSSGGHFVAVAGVEGGRIVIADPGRSKTPTYFDDNSIYPEGTITSLRVFKA